MKRHIRRASLGVLEGVNPHRESSAERAAVLAPSLRSSELAKQRAAGGHVPALFPRVAPERLAGYRSGGEERLSQRWAAGEAGRGRLQRRASGERSCRWPARGTA